MKKDIIDRYDLTETNQVIIDVTVRSVEALYNDFDRTAHYLKKDLDQAFVDYLIDCVREIGSLGFVIRISLTMPADGDHKARVEDSIRTYMAYLEELERREIKAMFRRSILLSAIGLGLLVLAVLANRSLTSGEQVLAQVFAEGLTIAAWVSLWEAIAIVLLEWQPHRKMIQIYRRIMAAAVIFREIGAEALGRWGPNP